MDDTDDETVDMQNAELVDESSQAFEEALNARIDERIEGHESDGLTENEVISLIEEYSGGDGGDGGGSVPTEFIERAEKALSRLELMTGLRGESRRVGPSGFDDGGYHSNEMWGIHFETDHPLYLSRASVDAEEAGSFHIKCWDVSDGVGDVVGEQVIHVVEGQQRIPLEMTIPPGEYHLSRPVTTTREEAREEFEGLPDSVFEPGDDAVPLWRGAYDGWDEDSTGGVTFHAGANPAFDDNENWYYFVDLALTVDSESG